MYGMAGALRVTLSVIQAVSSAATGASIREWYAWVVARRLLPISAFSSRAAASSTASTGPASTTCEPVRTATSRSRVNSSPSTARSRRSSAATASMAPSGCEVISLAR